MNQNRKLALIMLILALCSWVKETDNSSLSLTPRLVLELKVILGMLRMFKLAVKACWSLPEIIMRFIQLNMTRSSNWIFLPTAIYLLTVFGCSQEDKLERTIRRELASGVRNDSLFLGLKFGIELQEFYDHCRELNRQGLVTEGPKNMSVEYLFKDSLDNTIAFNFYAQRNDDDGPIHQYNTTFYYYAWVLNRHLQSDYLVEMLSPILMDWYGGNKPFTQIKDGKKHIYKIDGNRMIDMFIFDESTVLAIYSDLSHNNNP